MASRHLLVGAIKLKNLVVKVNAVKFTRENLSKLNVKFHFAGCKKVNDPALNALANFCPKIEILNLHSCDVNFNILLHHFYLHTELN